MNRTLTHFLGARLSSFILVASFVAFLAGPAFADGIKSPFGPELPGVYFENNGQHDWVPIRPEQARMAELTASGAVVHARLDRGYSRATLRDPIKLAVRINETENIASYRVYRLRSGSDMRTVRMNKPVAAEWVEIGFNLYELRLPANLTAGDYAVLPPGDGADRIYAFRYEPLRAPRSQALAFR